MCVRPSVRLSVCAPFYRKWYHIFGQFLLEVVAETPGYVRKIAKKQFDLRNGRGRPHPSTDPKSQKNVIG